MSVWRKDSVAKEHLQLLQRPHLLPSTHMAAKTCLKFQFYQACIRYINTNIVSVHTLFIRSFLHTLTIHIVKWMSDFKFTFILYFLLNNVKSMLMLALAIGIMYIVIILTFNLTITTSKSFFFFFWSREASPIFSEVWVP